MRRLIVTADDYGLSKNTTRGILQAHQKGIVTAASLMVRAPYARQAVREVQDAPRLALGLHLQLDSGERYGQSFAGVDLDDKAAVQAEIERQLALFQKLTGAPPTHIDGHQHLHLHDHARPLVERFGQQLGVPVRSLSDKLHLEAGFYGRPNPDAISAKGLLQLLADLPEGDSELMCHPAHGGQPGSSYSAERGIERKTLCKPAVRRGLEKLGIQLISPRDLIKENKVK